MSKKQKVSGAELFDQHFAGVFGARWPGLKEALQNRELKVARVNEFYKDQPRLEELVRPGNAYGLGEVVQSPEIGRCYHINEDFHLENFSTPILPFYRMDPASIVAAKALGVEPGHDVLDMCAAPGGKTLVLCEGLGPSGRLVANEAAAKRRFRMMGVVKRYLPAQQRSLIDIKGLDGARFGLGKARFDRILVDAPCSGERGVINKASDLEQWKPKRTKSFAVRQYALLASALLCLRPKGRVLYSTCSISPAENDGVISKLIKRQGDLIKILKVDTGAEKTDFGYQFLPDRDGWGPIYFCLIEKRDETQTETEAF